MSVGLDVHARSVVAAALDAWTGEILRASLSSDHCDVLGWVSQLSGPVAGIVPAAPSPRREPRRDPRLGPRSRSR